MKNKLFILFAFLSWIIPALILLFPIMTGNIPFWYDPARDMLSAWNNLHKITLIGPTSGIPGIFYGPYWIWFLSIPLFFSKDPRITTLIVSFLPYFVVFPVVLWQFRRMFGKWTVLLLWLLFILTYQSYAIFLWNPNNAPILFLLAMYLLASLDFSNHISKQVIRIVFAGLVVGLALNIDISFGIVFTLGSFLYLLITHLLLLPKSLLKRVKQFILESIAFVGGIVIMFAPFFLFEIRHGFEQTKTALHALSKGGAVVTVHGLTKPEIVQSFFGVFASLLRIPFLWAMGILLVGIGVLFIGRYKKKILLQPLELRLLIEILSISLACLGLYLSVRNPVWSYHFIGVEVLWLLFIGILISKIPYVKYVFGVWMVGIVLLSVINFLPTLSVSPLASASLMEKEHIVRTITEDAGSKQYSVFAYSPSIYIYEYSYLFRWLANKNVPYDPGMEKKVGNVYLILPIGNQNKLVDFIHFRTPDSQYMTTNEWHAPDGTIILKRELIK